MNYDVRPPRRGLLPSLSPDVINHIARLEYTIFTKANCNLAWRVFSQVDLWPQFCSLYKSARWQGDAWVPGSRLRLELGAPLHAVADRVVTACNPPHQLSWINHIRGYTMEQWVSLEPFYSDGCKISVWVEVTGGDPSRDRTEDMRLLQSVVVEWFENFRTECDRLAEMEASDIRSAAD